MEEFLLCNVIEIILLHGWPPVNFLRFGRITFLKNTYGGLPLDICTIKRNTQFLVSFPLHSYNSSISLLYKDCHLYSLHSHPQFPAFPPWFPAFPPWFPSFLTWVTAFPPLFPAFPPWFPAFSPVFLVFPPWFSAFPPLFPAFPPWFSAFLTFPHWIPTFPSFPSFRSPISYSGFYRQPLNLQLQR